MPDPRRLWRLRKQYQWVDAVLLEAADEVELRVSYNGEVAYVRRHPTRALAVADAEARRADLERDAWMPHW
jgi:hypothetical protein